MIWREVTEDAHDPVGQVSIEGVIAAQGQKAMFLFQLAALKPWLSHLYAQGLGLIAAGHHTAIVVGKHNDRLLLQVGSE